MIFGRPGSGKSTFAHKLSKLTGIPLHHLDKHFFVANWQERDTQAFMQTQQAMVASSRWIIDGNSLHSLATRWTAADWVLYFNYPKYRCLYQLIKRRFAPSNAIDDRADNCPNVLEPVQNLLRSIKRC